MLANIFLHLAFDTWMQKEHPGVPFERYADDVVVHCETEEQAQAVRKSVEERLARCKLEVNQEKTKLVYCKDENRRGGYPSVKFDFLGYTFRPRLSKRRPSGRRGTIFVNFSPAVSSKAAKAMRQEMRRWRLHWQNDRSLDDLARACNPKVRGWINYYGRYYKSALNPVFRQLNSSLVKWARWKYKKLRSHKTRAAEWLGQVAKREPSLFAHWQLLGLRSTAG